MQGIYMKKGNEFIVKDYTGVMFIVKGFDITKTFTFKDLKPWDCQSGVTKGRQNFS